jgi:1-acyl-sn-glycerol-3-phosphate acyltransferase
MGRLLYRAGWYVCRYIKQQCLNERVLHRDLADRPGGYVLAPTHVSHVEPLIVATTLTRPVHWMARTEFYANPLLAQLLKAAMAFPVKRGGVPVNSMRTAIDVAKRGHIVGIFPEGGCRSKSDLAFRGGRIKRGACVVAMRAGVPIVPVVILGTHKLNETDAWLPGKYGHAWTIFGEPIDPGPLPARHDRRRAREDLARRLERAYVKLYHELLETYGLDDAFTP